MRPDASWKTWESHEPSRYVEGQRAADRQPQDTPPPLVELAFEAHGDEEIERLVTIAADVQARELGLEPGNVFLLYREANAGRLFMGASVRRT